MIPSEQWERYRFQQTDFGKDILLMKEYMKQEYCRKLKIPVSEIKTGKLKPLVNEYTGEVERFIEE